jgi:diguanylate cyclase (GGDEF)-like protein
MKRMDMDPRLAEIKLLSELSQRQGAVVLSAPENASDYDLTETEFRHLVFGLIHDGCLLGDKILTSGGMPAADLLWRSTERILPPLEQGQRFSVAINHFGRLRLWRLRDEMNRRRIRDAFGILIDGRHFDDDLRVRFWMFAGQPISVMMSDLDHFKQVNDKVDHSKGDEAMRLYLAIAREIAGAHGGEAYRKGGDEVLSILPGLDASAGADAAEKLRRAVEESFKDFDKRVIPPTSSIGLATFNNFEHPEKVYRRVDQRLYAAKNSGRNRVVNSDP